MTFQHRVASVMGRNLRSGNTVILSLVYVCVPRRAQKADLNNRRAGSS